MNLAEETTYTPEYGSQGKDFQFRGYSSAVVPGSVDAAQQTDFDYSYVPSPAQIAVYDDFVSEPRIITVQPAPTVDFIGTLASTVYQTAAALGSTISYTIILQVTENFIHAKFSEMVVSIYNNGKTIRFADQGPGFKNKDRALQPGFTSATQPMKRYIKGVGSGLPTVKEWLQLSSTGGKITIEDNLDGGAVVTISVGEERPATQQQPKKPAFFMPSLNEKEKEYIKLLHTEGPLRITDLTELTHRSKSTVHTDIERLKEAGLVQTEPNTVRRMLTELGEEAAAHL